MRKFATLVLIGLLVLIGTYLALPAPTFPEPPPGSLVSVEPADTESIFRKAFYTNLSRAEIMTYYRKEFYSPLLLVLNLPPEDAAIFIRDQTRSSYLEEIVHPGKQSLFINGFVPDKIQDTIIRDNELYKSKITVRYVPSTLVTRFTVLLMIAVSTYLLVKEISHA